MATDMTKTQVGSLERRAPSVLDKLAAGRDRFLRLRGRQGVPVAILPEGMSKERFTWLREIGAEVIATPGTESNVKELQFRCLAGISRHGFDLAAHAVGHPAHGRCQRRVRSLPAISSRSV